MTKARSNATAEAAKGDLRAGTGTNLSGILAVGNNGETLVADSSTSTGLRYTAGNVQSNPVLNSAMQVWQRGTSVANSGGGAVYTADRWVSFGAIGAYTISRQATNDQTNLPSIQYCARIQRNSGQTSTASFDLLQGFETINSIPFSGKTITFSFYARSGANYSATSSALTVGVYSGTGTDQTPVNVYTGQAAVATGTATLTSTWQRFTYTGTVSTAATQLKLYFSMTPTGTALTNDYYEMTGAQIDIGSVALPFRTYAGTIQGELAACQRYYYRISNATIYEPFGIGYGVSGTRANIQLKPTTTMRTAPTLGTDFANLCIYDGTTATAVTNLTIDTGTSKDLVRLAATVASGGTQFRPYELLSNNSTSAYVGISAEL